MKGLKLCTDYVIKALIASAANWLSYYIANYGSCSVLRSNFICVA